RGRRASKCRPRAACWSVGADSLYAPLLLPDRGEAVSQAERLQYLRRRLVHRHCLVARRAVLGDGLPVLRGVALVVAAETAGERLVPKVVRIGPPGDLQVGEDVPPIQGRNGLASGVHVRSALAVDVGVRLPVIVAEGGRDLQRDFRAARKGG